MVIQRPRIMGAAALDICFVAQGASDGYFEHGIFIWDVAAAALILARAGGTSEILKAHGGYRLAFLASNSHLHSELKTRLLQVIRNIGAGIERDAAELLVVEPGCSPPASAVPHSEARPPACRRATADRPASRLDA